MLVIRTCGTLYFSEGYEVYKSCKNFINLCHHQDFQLAETYTFFSMNHDKSSCDGASRTVKHLVTKASLQMTLGNTTDSVDKLCNTTIEGIKF